MTGTAGPLAVNSVQARSSGQTTNEIRVQTLETSEEARRWNGGIDQPKRNDNAWRVSVGTAN